MSKEAAHKKWWQTFEVVFGIPFLIGLGLQRIKPLALIDTFMPLLIVPGAVALIIAGFILIVLARRELKRCGQHTGPGHPTTRLVTTGVFSISRNPLYLGGICILLGIALALNLGWALVLLLPALIVGRYILVMPEEQYLADKFGGEYAEYAGSVRRWFGRTRRTGTRQDIF